MKIHTGDRVTIYEPNAEPYEAEVLSIDPDAGELVGSLRARTTADPKGVQRVARAWGPYARGRRCRLGMEQLRAWGWDPYARGRRDRDRCRTLGAAVGSLRTRTTGRCRTVITPL